MTTPHAFSRPVNGLRLTWIIIGAIVAFLGIGALGVPFLIALFGYPFKILVAMAVAVAGFPLMLAVYILGITTFRSPKPERLPSWPPLAAIFLMIAVVAFGLFVVNTWGVW